MEQIVTRLVSLKSVSWAAWLKKFWSQCLVSCPQSDKEGHQEDVRVIFMLDCHKEGNVPLSFLPTCTCP